MASRARSHHGILGRTPHVSQVLQHVKDDFSVERFGGHPLYVELASPLTCPRGGSEGRFSGLWGSDDHQGIGRDGAEVSAASRAGRGLDLPVSPLISGGWGGEGTGGWRSNSAPMANDLMQ